MAKKLQRSVRKRNNGSLRSKGPWEPTVRDLEIFHAYNSGKMDYRAVGRAFKLSQEGARQICKKVVDWITPQYVEDIRGQKVRQTESLLHIFREAMQAWERSKLDDVTIREKKVEVAEAKIEGVETVMTTRGQAGDPRFLDQARGALDDIRKIWGMNAPIEIEYSGELRVAGMSVEEANKQLVDRIDSLKGRLLMPSTN